jgi:hypothetical protein
MSTPPTAFGRDEIYFGTERVRFAPAAGRAIAYVHAHYAPDIGAASVRRTLRRAEIPPVPAALAPPEAELPWIVPWYALDSSINSRAGSGLPYSIFQLPPPPLPSSIFVLLLQSPIGIDSELFVFTLETACRRSTLRPFTRRRRTRTLVSLPISRHSPLRCGAR